VKKKSKKKESAGGTKMKLPTINGTGDSMKSPRRPDEKGTTPMSPTQGEDPNNQSMILPADLSNPKANFLKFSNMQTGQVDLRQSSNLFSNDKNT
jgi:hypothetical protein